MCRREPIFSACTMPLRIMSDRCYNDPRMNRQIFAYSCALLALGLFLGRTAAGAERKVSLSTGWQQIGSVRKVKQEQTSYMFECTNGSAQIEVLASDLVRVRASRKLTASPDFSWSIAKTVWPHAKTETTRMRGYYAIRSDDLEIRVRLNPFRLAFYDRSGQLLSKDDDSLGLAWNGNQVRNWKAMPTAEEYFGLGEKVGRLDRRGRSYVMWNTDSYMYDFNHADPLYISIPFFLALHEGKSYGLFFDNSYRSSFDFGTESDDRYSFGAEDGEINYYFFAGPSPKTVIERYTELTGRMPMPPRWALGYEQTRYGYYPERLVRFIAENFRQRKIPCDALVIDIDYMDGYRIFTWDKERFPDPARMIADLRSMGIRTVLYQDPGIRVDSKYPAYQQALAHEMLLRKPDGEPFVGKVWAPETVFPDFTSERVRTWWGSLYKQFLAEGASGFENDMNEPSVLESPGRWKTIANDVIADDNGRKSRFAKVHNVFGMLMTRASYEGILQARPNERLFQTTRASFAGGQRYAAVFAGDNTSTWDGLRTSLQVLLSMGVSGFAHTGSEVGGFALSPSPELYARWIETGVFYPYFRTSADAGTRPHEPWSFGNEVEDISRQAIELRYRLLPYLYNAFHEASTTGLPVLRPLFLDFWDDPEAVRQNYEFLFGPDILAAPVVKDGEKQWDVYLPRGDWFDFWTARQYQGGKSYKVDAPLGRIPMFVRAGAILPTQQVVQYTDEAPINPLTLETFPADTSVRDYYEDDGISLAYLQGDVLEQRFSLARSGAKTRFSVSARQGPYVPAKRSLELKFRAEWRRPASVEANGRQLPELSTLDRYRAVSEGWFYDPEDQILWVKLPDEGSALEIDVG